LTTDIRAYTDAVRRS